MAYTTIDDPSAHFQVKLYTGNGNDGQAYTFDGNSDMQPDWLWVKNRSNTGPYSGNIFDSTRGANKGLFPDAGNAQSTNGSYGYLGAFQSDGFTVTSGSSGDERVNNNNDTYVMWGWKANGGTTTTNDASSTGVGSIDSVYQINSTSKFSIVTYTGNGSSGANFAHGLGVAPDFVLTKNLDTERSWLVGHHTIGFGFTAGHLNSTDDKDEDSVYWNNTAPSSTVVTLGNNEGGNESGDDFVAYCFTEVQGFSKFGTYTGNGNADGPFVYLGFKPAFLIIKNMSDANDQWIMWDNKRSPSNPVDDYLEPSTSAAESANSNWAIIDFVSNGFKLRSNDISYNQNTYQYIYIAFAENPFVSSEGVPTTAR